ncbi:MAG: PfkB family carbohydrate kinase [Isosphaeraceae bacterium]
MTGRRVEVFGPAYLDRVLRVDRPLIDPIYGSPLDQSVDGVREFGPDGTLDLIDPSGYTISIDLPADWPGPTGTIRWNRPIREGLRGRRSVRCLSWQDDLGGMGAGYASALNGRLHSALGSEADPTSRAISRKLDEYGVEHIPIRVPDCPADWTLLVTSGEYGDKLPIGFRGCHARLTPESLAPMAAEPCDLRVVAGLPNHLAVPVVSAPMAKMRFLAPAMRNMIDVDCHLLSFADAIDVLSCNRREWEALESHEEVARLVSILIVTDGPAGSTVRFTAPGNEPGRLQIPAFPRAHPPRDTNRAGEAFGSTFVASLLDHGWDAASVVADEALIRTAAERASAASALVLDRLDFGFPTSEEIEAALRAGRVG